MHFFVKKARRTIFKIGESHGAKDKPHEELRALLATIHHWSPKWVYGEPIHLLCQSEKIVRYIIIYF